MVLSLKIIAYIWKIIGGIMILASGILFLLGLTGIVENSSSIMSLNLLGVATSTIGSFIIFMQGLLLFGSGDAILLFMRMENHMQKNNQLMIHLIKNMGK